MAFDLIVGKTFYTRDNPVILGAIEFDQNRMICSLYKKHGGTFLRNLTNPFNDFTLYHEDLKEEKRLLYRLMESDKLNNNERSFIYMLAAIVNYAIDTGLPLHGVAD